MVTASSRSRSVPTGEDIERILVTMPHLAPGEKAFADANRGLTVDEALSVARATAGLDYIMEQPCKTYDECQQLRAVLIRRETG